MNQPIPKKYLKKESLWIKAWRKFRQDKFGVFALTIVMIYFLVAMLVWMGFIATDWSELIADGRMGPSSAHWFGTNANGQDVFDRAMYSTKTAFEIGLIVAVLSVLIGGVLGALSGYFAGSWLDEFIIWIYGCLDSIPFYLFVAAVAFALEGNVWAMHIAMISTFWIGTARIVRGEFIKLKHFEFVEAAKALGISERNIIFRHIFPNTLHIILVQTSLIFIAAIKAEVVLSFLGLGVKDGISWGLMIAESTQEVASGIFNNFLSASILMFVLVLSFNMFSDSLQDALDPKKVTNS